jgi:excisionase family DNA binding protein
MNDILPAEVSVAEAAKYLGVGRKIIYQLLEFGELRAVREHGKIIIDPCSLRDFRESGKQP